VSFYYEYLGCARRDRMMTRGVSVGIPGDPSELYVLSARPAGLNVPDVPAVGGSIEVIYSNPVLASSFLTFEDYADPLMGSEGRLWMAGSDYGQMSFKRTFAGDNRRVSLLMNKAALHTYF